MTCSVSKMKKVIIYWRQRCRQNKLGSLHVQRLRSSPRWQNVWKKEVCQSWRTLTVLRAPTLTMTNGKVHCFGLRFCSKNPSEKFTSPRWKAKLGLGLGKLGPQVSRGLTAQCTAGSSPVIFATGQFPKKLASQITD